MWWNTKHNWDGVTHWSRYIIISPAYLGPNALPVPETKDGSLPAKSSLEVSVENYFSPGDNTQNLFSNLYLPLFSEKVGLNISMVPVEHFKMDTITRDIRRVRDFDGEGFSSGDFYIGTYIQVLKDYERWPDIMVSLNLKTASGGKLSAARFTDSPGYFFDLSVGKEFRFYDSFIKSVRPYGMAGFYAWQTNREDYYQNDAILYGIGYNLLFKKLELQNSLEGYWGYIGNGDRPVVVSVTLQSKNDSAINFKVSFQHGMMDNLYNLLSAGFEIELRPITKIMLPQVITRVGY